MVISETVTVLDSSDSPSLMENATVDWCCRGWADWWHGVGSIDLKLAAVSKAPNRWRDALLSEKVAEIRNGVLRVSHELRLGLGSLELLAVDVGENRGDLSVCKTSAGYPATCHCL